MKIGVFTALYPELSLEEVLDKVAALGCQAVEIGTGNYPGDAHLQPDRLLVDPGEVKRVQRALADRRLIISALSCHGNPLHPNPEIARAHHATWRKTVRVAEQLEVDTICLFSGCPGDSDDSRCPNWVTCAWPPDYGQILRWQWKEKVIPYWQEEVEFARRHGVTKLAFEMHPGFVVYNPETLLRLRQAVGKEVGANFDPSHLIWQGIEPAVAARVLGAEGAIYHVHAKDTYLDTRNVQVNGVLDTKDYADFARRSWFFRTVGYGMTTDKWRELISVFRLAGYDYVLSIEHEDGLAGKDEGLARAVEVLKGIIFQDQPGNMHWI